jgi:hypothetical protein
VLTLALVIVEETKFLMSDSDVGDDALHSGPSFKRIKLGSESPTLSNDANKQSPKSSRTGTVLEDNCTICLQAIVDRTVIPVCSHEFCYECILVWSGACSFFHVDHPTVEC